MNFTQKATNQIKEVINARNLEIIKEYNGGLSFELNTGIIVNYDGTYYEPSKRKRNYKALMHTGFVNGLKDISHPCYNLIMG